MIGASRGFDKDGSKYELILLHLVLPEIFLLKTCGLPQ
jgi:hypothetical protein